MIDVRPAPTCPLCDSFSRRERPFDTADPACIYWRCTDCEWLFAIRRPDAPFAHLDEPELAGLPRVPAHLSA